MAGTPKSLEQDPIIEAVFEIRFAAKQSSIGDLLPGLVFPRLKKLFPTITSLPLAQVPKALRDATPGISYHPTHALVGESMRLMLGERVVGLSVAKPYPGWAKLKPVITEVLEALSAIDVVGSVERFSLKYVNVITMVGEVKFPVLKTVLRLGDFKLKPDGQQIRAEIEHGGCVHVVSIITGATINVSGYGAASQTLSGLVVDVDTVRNGPFTDPWRQVPNLLDPTHEAEKEIFFGLLTKDATDHMKPIWK